MSMSLILILSILIPFMVVVSIKSYQCFADEKRIRHEELADRKNQGRRWND
jgi:hypothetical protein